MKDQDECGANVHLNDELGAHAVQLATWAQAPENADAALTLLVMAQHCNEAATKLVELEREVAFWKAEAEAGREDYASALSLLSRVRFACGDNGKRMQDELETYLRDQAQNSRRYVWLRDNCTVSMSCVLCMRREPGEWADEIDRLMVETPNTGG